MIAARLDEVVRAGDTLGHLEQERFVILAEDSTPADLLVALSERVESAFAAPFEIIEENRAAVSVSVRPRLACATATSSSAHELLRDAELALLRRSAAPGHAGAVHP